MPPKVKLILNPMADMGHAWRVANDLRPEVQRYGHADWSGTVYPTHATELAIQAAEQGYDRVVAMGGDGTVHEVVNGLMRVPAERRPALGVVPVGSGNDFAFAAGIPTNPAEALQLALHGEPKAVDIGHVTSPDGYVDEYFDNTLGVGFDTVVTIRSHRLPLLRGFLMYLVSVFEVIALDHKGVNYRIQTDEGELVRNALMMVACNGGREGGGFMLSPEARIDDGFFDMLVVDKVSRLMMLRLLPEFMRGTHLGFPQVRLQRTRTLRLEADAPLYIHADGEVLTSFGSDVRVLDFSMFPAALPVIRP